MRKSKHTFFESKVNPEIGQAVQDDDTSLPDTLRRNYSLANLLAMQGGEPLVMDAQWEAMPAVGQEVAF